MLKALIRKGNALNTRNKAALIIHALKPMNGGRVSADNLKWLLYKTYGQSSSALFTDLNDVLRWCYNLDILRRSRSNYIIYNDKREGMKSWVTIFRFLRECDELDKMDQKK